MALPAGTRLAFYEIVEPIGAGAMGEVYRAGIDVGERPHVDFVLPGC